MFIYIVLVMAGLAVFIVILLRKRAALRETLAREISTEPGTVLFQPQKGSFRGSTARYGSIKNDGAMYLTTERLVFHPYIGKNVIKIKLGEIDKVVVKKFFKGEGRMGMPVTVLHLKDGTQVGFYIPNKDEWIQAIEKELGS